MAVTNPRQFRPLSLILAISLRITVAECERCSCWNSHNIFVPWLRVGLGIGLSVFAIDMPSYTLVIAGIVWII